MWSNNIFLRPYIYLRDTLHTDVLIYLLIVESVSTFNSITTDFFLFFAKRSASHLTLPATPALSISDICILVNISTS